MSDTKDAARGSVPGVKAVIMAGPGAAPAFFLLLKLVSAKNQVGLAVQ